MHLKCIWDKRNELQKKGYPGCLGNIGDCTTQSYGDYNEPLCIRIPYSTAIFASLHFQCFISSPCLGGTRVLGVSAVQCLGHPWSAECGWELVSGSIEALWPDLTEEIGREGCRNGFCQLGRWHQTCPDFPSLPLDDLTFFLGRGRSYYINYITLSLLGGGESNNADVWWCCGMSMDFSYNSALFRLVI